MNQDNSKLYKITYRNGQVKYGNRRTVANVVGHQNYWKKVVAIGVADMPAEFTDATDEFPKVTP